MDDPKNNQADTVARPLLVGVFMIIMALMAFAAWQTWALHEESRDAGTRHARLRELAGVMAELDALQVAAARAATATWDLHWEDQFGSAGSRLESAVEEFLRLSPDAELSWAVARTQAANVKMITTAKLAMELAARGRRSAAQELLAGDDFGQQQLLYQEGVQRIGQLLTARAESEHQRQRQRALAAVVAAGAALPLLLVGCVGLLRAGRFRRVADQSQATVVTLSAAAPTTVPVVESVGEPPPAVPPQMGSQLEEPAEEPAQDAPAAEVEPEPADTDPTLPVEAPEETKTEGEPAEEKTAEPARAEAGPQESPAACPADELAEEPPTEGERDVVAEDAAPIGETPAEVPGAAEPADQADAAGEPTGEVEAVEEPAEQSPAGEATEDAAAEASPEEAAAETAEAAPSESADEPPAPADDLDAALATAEKAIAGAEAED